MPRKQSNIDDGESFERDCFEERDFSSSSSSSSSFYRPPPNQDWGRRGLFPFPTNTNKKQQTYYSNENNLENDDDWQQQQQYASSRRRYDNDDDCGGGGRYHAQMGDGNDDFEVEEEEEDEEEDNTTTYSKRTKYRTDKYSNYDDNKKEQEEEEEVEEESDTVFRGKNHNNRRKPAPLSSSVGPSKNSKVQEDEEEEEGEEEVKSKHRLKQKHRATEKEEHHRSRASFMLANQNLSGFGSASSALLQTLREFTENALDSGARNVRVSLTPIVEEVEAVEEEKEKEEWTVEQEGEEERGGGGGERAKLGDKQDDGGRNGAPLGSSARICKMAPAPWKHAGPAPWLVQVEDDGVGIERHKIRSLLGKFFASTKESTSRNDDSNAAATAAHTDNDDEDEEGKVSGANAIVNHFGKYGIGVKAAILYAQTCQSTTQQHQRQERDNISAIAPLYVATSTCAEKFVTTVNLGINVVDDDVIVADEVLIEKEMKEGEGSTSSNASGTLMSITVNGDGSIRQKNVKKGSSHTAAAEIASYVSRLWLLPRKTVNLSFHFPQDWLQFNHTKVSTQGASSFSSSSTTTSFSSSSTVHKTSEMLNLLERCRSKQSLPAISKTTGEILLCNPLLTRLRQAMTEVNDASGCARALETAGNRSECMIASDEESQGVIMIPSMFDNSEENMRRNLALKFGVPFRCVASSTNSTSELVKVSCFAVMSPVVTMSEKNEDEDEDQHVKTPSMHDTNLSSIPHHHTPDPTPTRMNDVLNSALRVNNTNGIIHLLRYANGVPLLRHANACAITSGAIHLSNWSEFGLSLHPLDRNCSSSTKRNRSSAQSTTSIVRMSKPVIDALTSYPASPFARTPTTTIDVHGAYIAESAMEDFPFIPFHCIHLLINVESAASSCHSLQFGDLAKTFLTTLNPATSSASSSYESAVSKSVESCMSSLRSQLPSGLFESTLSLQRRILLNIYLPAIANHLALIVNQSSPSSELSKRCSELLQQDASSSSATASSSLPSIPTTHTSNDIAGFLASRLQEIATISIAIEDRAPETAIATTKSKSKTSTGPLTSSVASSLLPLSADDEFEAGLLAMVESHRSHLVSSRKQQLQKSRKGDSILARRNNESLSSVSLAAASRTSVTDLDAKILVPTSTPEDEWAWTKTEKDEEGGTDEWTGAVSIIGAGRESNHTKIRQVRHHHTTAAATTTTTTSSSSSSSQALDTTVEEWEWTAVAPSLATTTTHPLPPGPPSTKKVNHAYHFSYGTSQQPEWGGSCGFASQSQR